jgi:hypothetical protein
MSFSFDPVSMSCKNCPGRGEHALVGGVGGGTTLERQTFALADQNFSPCLPCSSGECLKVFRGEDGSLKEIVSGFLDLTRGKEIATGSVVLLFSATHLLLRGVAGYMADFMEETARIESAFRGGLICSHGVPTFGEGIKDTTLIRAVLELNEWMKISGENFSKSARGVLAEGILLEKIHGSFVTETFRHPMLLKGSAQTRSWVSSGWASPSGVRQSSPEMEKLIVHALVRDLNANFDVGLCADPVTVPDPDLSGPDTRKPKFLFIGGSHSLREAQCLADKGYDVITCAVSGWRANKTACEEMAEKVQEALRGLCEDDTAFMARTEEGGDLPIRNIAGEYHVEGDLVVASKERLYMFFKNCLPFLTLLAGRLVLFLTPLPRYVYTCCCTNLEHAANRAEPGFKEDIKKALAECRDHYKNFLFTSGLRGFVIRNPGLCVPEMDKEGMCLWTEDPVNPTPEGYSRIVDMILSEADRMRGKAGSKKRSGNVLEAASKRPHQEVPRPNWVSETCAATSRQDGARRGGDRG